MDEEQRQIAGLKPVENRRRTGRRCVGQDQAGRIKAKIHAGLPDQCRDLSADAATQPLADGLEAAVGEAASVIDVVRYRVGPSVGAHTGPGTVGCFVFPA